MLHYTVFGFLEEGGVLQQELSMHVNEDESSSYVASRKRQISWDDIRHLFVRIPISILFNLSECFSFLGLTLISSFLILY
jgi:hypothetical protein